eukprot:gene10427-biopygen6817
MALAVVPVPDPYVRARCLIWSWCQLRHGLTSPLSRSHLLPCHTRVLMPCAIIHLAPVRTIVDGVAPSAFLHLLLPPRKQRLRIAAIWVSASHLLLAALALSTGSCL